MRIRRSKVATWLAIALLTGLSIGGVSALRGLFSETVLIEQLQRSHTAAPLLFLLGSTLAIALGFPGNLLAVVGGAVFGLLWGTLLSLAGATMGAIAAFCLARSVLHLWISRRFEQHPLLVRLNAAIVRQPLNVVLAVRFTPISPFSLVNFLFGLTPVDLKTYSLGTFLGIIPLTLTYTWLGTSGQQAWTGGDRGPVGLAVAFLALLALLPILLKKTSRQKPQTPRRNLGLPLK